MSRKSLRLSAVLFTIGFEEFFRVLARSSVWPRCGDETEVLNIKNGRRKTQVTFSHKRKMPQVRNYFRVAE